MTERTQLRVLLVEDDAASAYLARFLLTSAGFDTHEAHDGLSAVDSAVELTPDIVLMDIMLPGIDGLEAVRRIRAAVDPAPVCIALTAHAMKGDREAMMHAGCDGYIAKPVETTTFVAEIKAILSSMGR